MVSIKSKTLYQKAVQLIKKKGYANIKANSEDLELEVPTSYALANGEDAYTPDITATYLGRKNYFEISMKTDSTKRLIGKWQLLSRLAQIKQGNFFLLVPRGHLRFTNQLLEDYNIEASLIKI